MLQGEIDASHTNSLDIEWHLDMQVLGGTLVTPFNEFWNVFENIVSVDPALISLGHSAIFGDQGADRTKPKLPVWMSLPHDELSYHNAHEIFHLIMTSLKYPSVVYELGCAVDPGEVRVGKDLEDMVLHPALDTLIDRFGFDNTFILEHTASGAFDCLRSGSLPAQGASWFLT